MNNITLGGGRTGKMRLKGTIRHPWVVDERARHSSLAVVLVAYRETEEWEGKGTSKSKREGNCGRKGSFRSKRKREYRDGKESGK